MTPRENFRTPPKKIGSSFIWDARVSRLKLNAGTRRHTMIIGVFDGAHFGNQIRPFQQARMRATPGNHQLHAGRPDIRHVE